jgi:hypothetical protein
MWKREKRLYAYAGAHFRISILQMNCRKFSICLSLELDSTPSNAGTFQGERISHNLKTYTTAYRLTD